MGERVDVKRLDLPARFESGDDTAENERVAIARVARGAAALRLGLIWADDTTRAMATRLAEPLLRATLIAELPGAQALLDEADAIAARRAPPAPVMPAGDRPTDLASLRRAVAALPKVGHPGATPESLGGLPRPAPHARAMTEPTLTEGEGAAGTEREGGARKAKRVDLGEDRNSTRTRSPTRSRRSTPPRSIGEARSARTAPMSSPTTPTPSTSSTWTA